MMADWPLHPLQGTVPGPGMGQTLSQGLHLISADGKQQVMSEDLVVQFPR